MLSTAEQAIIDEMTEKLSKIWAEGVADGSIQVTNRRADDPISQAFAAASKQIAARETAAAQMTTAPSVLDIAKAELSAVTAKAMANGSMHINRGNDQQDPIYQAFVAASKALDERAQPPTE